MLILGTDEPSVHEKIFQIGAIVLALELDKGRVLGGVATPPTEQQKLTFFVTMKMTFSLSKFWHEVR